MATMKKTAPKKPAYSTKAKAKDSIVQDITNRYTVTAREARDIVTAVGTYLKTIKDIKPDPIGITPTSSSMRALGQSSSNLKKQIKETATAAMSGKTGTTSAKSKQKRVVTPGKPR